MEELKEDFEENVRDDPFTNNSLFVVLPETDFIIQKFFLRFAIYEDVLY